jgi:hypothetical protein
MVKISLLNGLPKKINAETWRKYIFEILKLIILRTGYWLKTHNYGSKLVFSVELICEFLERMNCTKVYTTHFNFFCLFWPNSSKIPLFLGFFPKNSILLCIVGAEICSVALIWYMNDLGKFWEEKKIRR